jgi:hypothetical protein
MIQQQQKLVDSLTPALYGLLDAFQKTGGVSPTFKFDGVTYVVKAGTAEFRGISTGGVLTNVRCVYVHRKGRAKPAGYVLQSLDDYYVGEQARFKRASNDMVSAFAVAAPDMIAHVKAHAAAQVERASAGVSGLQELAGLLS